MFIYNVYIYIYLIRNLQCYYSVYLKQRKDGKRNLLIYYICNSTGNLSNIIEFGTITSTDTPFTNRIKSKI